MPIPLGGDFKVAVTKPIDDRMTVTNYNDLNNITNKYVGLICYVSSEKNLYVFQDSNRWEKIITNNVDNPAFITTNFNITQSYNGQVLYINSNSATTGTLVGPFEDGFNISFVQMGIGPIVFNSGVAGTLRNKIGSIKTDGQYGIASILKIGNTTDFLLYGDVIN